MRKPRTLFRMDLFITNWSGFTRSPDSNILIPISTMRICDEKTKDNLSYRRDYNQIFKLRRSRETIKLGVIWPNCPLTPRLFCPSGTWYRQWLWHPEYHVSHSVWCPGVPRFPYGSRVGLQCGVDIRHIGKWNITNNRTNCTGWPLTSHNKTS